MMNLMTDTPAKTHLFLFDIDGTLIASGGAGESSLKIAVEEEFGAPDDLSDIEIAGRTDKLIGINILKKYGVEPTPERMTKLLDRYLFHLAQELPRRKGRVLPGIIELLDALKSKPNVVLALLTGNLEKGAELKLTHYGVWNYFEFGAYADDSHDRNCLGPVAQERALNRHGVEFPPDRIFVLGDTPHDIRCGVAIGAKTVAIATGGYSFDQLAAHRPDFLFHDLADVDGVLRALGV
jgi:phosphoglycolate phosphatase-like HAD superfamily hydrolase